MSKNPAITRFNGLNNVSDALTLGLAWMVTANNLNVTDAGKLEQRSGYALSQSGDFTDAFSTKNFDRTYLVDGGSLKTFEGTVLMTGLDDSPMFWAEINHQVYFNNGVDAGIINPDNTLLDLRWTAPSIPTLAAVTGNLDPGIYRVCVTNTLADGRETGTSDPLAITIEAGQALQISDLSATSNVYICAANSKVFNLAPHIGTAMVWNSSPDNLGRELMTDNMDPLPLGAECLAFFRGRLYAAHYFPADDQTAIWFSQPLGFHLFNLNTDFYIVPGKVLMLGETDTALIVGTDKAIHAYTAEGRQTLADYGVIAGQHWSEDGGKGYFWSERGLCSALPFQNLTEQQISVAPGVSAGGVVVNQDGQKRYLVALQQGGTAFNPHS